MVSQPWEGSDVGGLEGVDRPLAVALLIKFANLRGECPHLSPVPTLNICVPWVCLLTICVYVLVRVCVGTHLCVCARTQVLLAELCPLSGDHLLWPCSVLVCVGIKGGMMGIKRKVKVLDYTAEGPPQIDVPLNPSALFWVLLYVGQRTVGRRETDTWNTGNLHTCGYNRLINAFVTPGRLLVCADRRLVDLWIQLGQRGRINGN